MAGARGCFNCGGCAWCFRVVVVVVVAVVDVVACLVYRRSMYLPLPDPSLTPPPFFFFFSCRMSCGADGGPRSLYNHCITHIENRHEKNLLCPLSIHCQLDTRLQTAPRRAHLLGKHRSILFPSISRVFKYSSKTDTNPRSKTVLSSHSYNCEFRPSSPSYSSNSHI